MDKKSQSNAFLSFDSIAEKEMLMYQAVIEMVREDYDINSIKVSDITSRAGIGKGTAYEYFSSKEEIIVKALFYDTHLHLKKVEGILNGTQPYKSKLYTLLDYLEENLPHSKGTGSLMKMLSGTYEIKEDIKKELERLHAIDACPVSHIEKMIDAFMVQGLDEKLYTQENVILRRSVFATQVTGYIYCIMNNFYGGQFPKEEAKNFTYDSIIKLLNS